MFCSGGVESPLAISGTQLWPDVRVAIAATFNVLLLVLALEMEDVDWKCTAVKVSSKVVVIVIEHRTNAAVVVMPENRRE